MAATRETVKYQLDQFLSGKISQENLYSWTLAQVMDEEYEKLAAKDPVLRETVQTVIDFNHSDLDRIPTREDLLFYKRCLDGQEQFVPFSERWTLRQKNEKGQTKSRKPPKEKDKEFFAVLSRIYVSLFGLSIFCIYLIGLVKPEVFHPGETPSRADILRESLPHLIYSVFLLLPMRTLAQGVLYYVSLTVFVMGAVFYWYAPVSLVIKYDLNVFLFILFAPFTGLPAALSIWLIMSIKNKLLR